MSCKSKNKSSKERSKQSPKESNRTNLLQKETFCDISGFFWVALSRFIIHNNDEIFYQKLALSWFDSQCGFQSGWNVSHKSVKKDI